MKNIISLFIALAFAGSAAAQSYEAAPVTEGGSYSGLSLYQNGKLAFTNDGKLYEAAIKGSQLTNVQPLENLLPSGWVADGLTYDQASNVFYLGAKAPHSTYAIHRLNASGGQSPERIFPLEAGKSGNSLVNAGWVLQDKTHNAMQPGLSNGGKRLWFTSDMPGGKGLTDVWYMDMQANGSWGKPVNAESINTTGSDEYPFISGDKMFFTSDGLSSLGGQDIYTAATVDGLPQAIQNINEPISSTSSDKNFVLTGKRAWFISNRDGSTRIYTIEYPKPEPVVAPAPQPEPAPAPEPKPAPVPAPAPPKDVLKELNIPKLEFAYNSHKLLPASEKYISQVAQALKERANVTFEVSGHSDATGNADRNIALSQKRAQYVMERLVANGVPAKNLKAKGYGSAQPLMNCSTPECNAANRRVEIKPIQ